MASSGEWEYLNGVVVKQEVEDPQEEEMQLVEDYLAEVKMEEEEESEEHHPPPQKKGRVVKKKVWRKRKGPDTLRKERRDRQREKRAMERALKPPPPPKPPKPPVEKKPKPPRPPKPPTEPKPKKERPPPAPPEVKREKKRFWAMMKRLSLTPEERSERWRQRQALNNFPARRRYQQRKETLGEEALREKWRQDYRKLTPEQKQRRYEKMKPKLKEMRLRKKERDPEKWAEYLRKMRESARQRKERERGGVPVRPRKRPQEEKRTKEEMERMDQKEWMRLQGKRRTLMRQLEIRQKLLETGMTIEQVVATPEMAEKRERQKQKLRVFAAQKSMRKRLEREGVNPEEIERQVEELGRTYTGVRQGREYRPRSTTKYYDSGEIERIQKELHEVEEALRRMRQEAQGQCPSSSQTDNQPGVSARQSNNSCDSFAQEDFYEDETASSEVEVEKYTPSAPPPPPETCDIPKSVPQASQWPTTYPPVLPGQPLLNQVPYFPPSTFVQPPTSSLDRFSPQDSADWQDNTHLDSDNAYSSSNPDNDDDSEPPRDAYPSYSRVAPSPAPSTTSSSISRAGRPPKAVPNPLLCTECGRSFADRCNLRHHLNYYHNPYYSPEHKQCLLCHGRFSTPKGWYAHFCAAHSAQHQSYRETVHLPPQRLPRKRQAPGRTSQQIICDECGRVFAHRDSLTLHKNFYHHPSYNRDQKSCRECGQVFKKAAFWYSHFRSTHQPPPSASGGSHICEECGKVYTKQDSLYQHQRRAHSTEESRPCPVCRKEMKRKDQMARHLREYHPGHQAAAHHQCLRCPQAFLKVEALKDHVRDSHPQSYFPCEFCGLLKFSRLALHAHYYRTSVCKKIAPGEGKRMRREWPKEKDPFILDFWDISCELCGGKSLLSRLSRHYQIIHNVKEDEWKCGECGKQFKRREYWAGHLEEVHEKSVEELEGLVGKLNAKNREGMKEAGRNARAKKGSGRSRATVADSEEDSESGSSSESEEEEKEVKVKRKPPHRKEKPRRKVVVICEEDES